MIGQKTFLSRTASPSDSGTVPFVPFALLVPCRHLIAGHPVHGAPSVFVTFVPFCSKPHSRFPKAIQAYSRLLNPIQGVLEKVFFYFSGLLDGFESAQWDMSLRVRHLEIPKSSQASPKLSKPFQGQGRGRGLVINPKQP